MKVNFIDQLHDIFIQYADQPAMWVDYQFYTYGNLYKKANQLTGFLKTIEESNGVFSILSERSIHFYEAMIASFLAGFIYTPINIHEGMERNQKILEIANPDIIYIGTIDIDRLLAFIGTLPRKKLVIVDYYIYQHLKSLRTHHVLFYVDFTIETENNRYLISPSHHAYLFFTSGTTGVPKGVPISYDNLNAYIDGIFRVFTFNAGGHFIQLSDIAFDISIHEILIAFLSGGTLYVYNDQHELNITPFFIDKKIEYCFLVPTAMKIFLDQCQFYHFELLSLKVTLVCGEAFALSLAKTWKNIAKNSLIANLYGPTETTIACTYHIFNENNNYKNLFTVPIGFPFCHVQLEMTADHELVVIGNQVAGQYLGQENSNHRFYFHSILNKNAYLTGDIVRYDSQWGYIFLSRLDDQWQIQGYRLEKGEIESVLRTVCDVQDIFVVPHRNHQQLIDFLLAYTTEKINLNHYPQLLHHLPKVAIPKKTITLSTIPKLFNGKINYKALQRFENEEEVTC